MQRSFLKQRNARKFEESDFARQKRHILRIGHQTYFQELGMFWWNCDNHTGFRPPDGLSSQLSTNAGRVRNGKVVAFNHPPNRIYQRKE